MRPGSIRSYLGSKTKGKESSKKQEKEDGSGAHGTTSSGSVTSMSSPDVSGGGGAGGHSNALRASHSLRNALGKKKKSSSDVNGGNMGNSSAQSKKSEGNASPRLTSATTGGATSPRGGTATQISALDHFEMVPSAHHRFDATDGTHDGNKEEDRVLLASLLAIWRKPLKDLPTAKDLPRLGQGMRFLDSFGDEVGRVEEKAGNARTALMVISHLAQLLDAKRAPKIVRDLENLLGVRMDGDTIEASQEAEADVAGQLLEYFVQSAEGTVSLSYEGKLARMLKAIQQEMISPVVKRLRSAIYGNVPFKDRRGTWKICLQSLEDGSWILSHFKQEHAHSYEESEYFWFEWALRLHFNPEVTRFSANYCITDYGFGEQVPDEYQNTIKSHLRPFTSRLKLYRAIWRKPDLSNSIAKSWERLAMHLTIQSEAGETLFTARKQDAPVQNIMEALVTLAKALNPELVDAIRDSFYVYVHADGSGDVAQQLRQFLRVEVIPEDSKTMQVLRLIHCDMPYPAILELKKHIYPKMRYKDMKNSWDASIVLGDRLHTVCLGKKECSYNIDSTEYFVFSWKIELVLSKDLEELRDVTFQVTDCSVHEDVDVKYRRKICQYLKPYTSRDTTYGTVRSVSIADVLSTAAESLERSMADGIPVAIKNFSGPVDLVQLLRSAQSSLGYAYDIQPVYVVDAN